MHGKNFTLVTMEFSCKTTFITRKNFITRKIWYTYIVKQRIFMDLSCAQLVSWEICIKEGRGQNVSQVVIISIEIAHIFLCKILFTHAIKWASWILENLMIMHITARLQTLAYKLEIELPFGKKSWNKTAHLVIRFCEINLVILLHLEVDLLHYGVSGHLGPHTFSDLGCYHYPSS